MDAIFGREKKREDPELLSPRNGMIMDTRAENKSDRGLFTIVPLMSAEPSEAETAAWHASDPKRYKIRIILYVLLYHAPLLLAEQLGKK